jgi:hypothetical protein
LAKEVTIKADCFPKFGLEVVWRFGITISSPDIRVLDGVAEVQWLSIKGKAMVWIDAGEGINFALVIGKEVADLIQVLMWVLRFSRVLVVLVEWAEPPSACLAKVGLLWLVRCGIVGLVFAHFLFLVFFALLVAAVGVGF